VVGSDLFTTICAITKAPVPQDRPIDGVSLLPAFRNQALERKIPLYWRCAIAPDEFKIAMRQGDHTLLANPAMTRFELYNLKTDVRQTTDLKDREADRFEAMRATLIRLTAEIEKEGPPWWHGKEVAPKKKEVPKIDKQS